MTLHLVPPPIEIDPRPCLLCGLTINYHEMIDADEGPEFYCIDISPDEVPLPELERRAELIREIEIAAMVKQMELDDPRDRWRHTGEPPPPLEAALPPPRPSYHTPRSTILAFWHVAGLDDADHLKRWLAQHPRDVETLQKLWEAKHAGA